MSKAQLQLVTDSDTLDDLVRLEQEINEGINRFYEDEYYVAVRLMHIRERSLYEKVGFDSWTAYCASDRLHVGKTHADRNIKYAKVRANLADMPPEGGVWSEYNARPLTSLDPKDARRISGKIATHLKRNPKERLSESIVKEFIAADKGVGVTSLPEPEEPGLSLQDYLRDISKQARSWRRQLEEVPSGGWDEVEKSFPRLLTRVRKDLADLVAYLEE